MKKTRFTTLALVLVMMLAFSMVANAAGPFFDGNVDDIGFDEDIRVGDGAGLKAAVESTGQELAAGRQFVEGNPSAWNDENEGAHMLFDGAPGTKYGSHVNDDPYMAIWKYSEAFVAGHILLCTANDSAQYARRMDDGWTLSGSNDGSSWTVIYTGKGEDVDLENYAWFTVAIPNNTTAYTHYRLFSEFGFDGDGIQYSEVELTKVAQAAAPEPEPAPAVVEAAPEAPAPAPAQVSATPAPRTADPIVIIALGSILSAAGVVIARKRK